jgi:hypothetical protein
MSETKPKPFVFVLMPFDTSFEDVYEVGIKAVCGEAGAYCERVDEQIFEGSILSRIYNQISKADIIVADMTGRNPNVFYEVGYAHALGKQVVLLTHKAEDIPFDLKHYPHIVYDGKIVRLKAELAKRIRWLVENPTKRLEKVENTIELFLGNLRLSAPQQVEWRRFFELKIHNPTARVIQSGTVKIGFVAPSLVLRFPENDYRPKGIGLPDKKTLWFFPTLDSLLPSDWVSFRFGVSSSLSPEERTEIFEGRRERKRFTEDARIRVFCEIGTFDYALRIKSIPDMEWPENWP